VKGRKKKLADSDGILIKEWLHALETILPVNHQPISRCLDL
jgi:hypothetical protein